MSGTKISAMSSLAVLSDSTIIPVVDGGLNYKLTTSSFKTYLTTSNFLTASSLSVGTPNAASGTGAISYSAGVFKYTPPDLSGYATTASLSSYVTSSSLSSTLASYATTSSLSSYATTASLSSYVTSSSLSSTLASYATTSSLSSYVTSATLSGYNYITTSSLSVGTANAASGTGAISYSAGVFKYTPPDLSSYAPLAGPTFTGAVTAGASTTVKDVRDTVYSSGTTTGTITPDCANGDIQTITLTGSITFNGFANAVSGQSMTMLITQPSSGGPYTLTSTMKFANGVKTLSTAANAVDMLTVSYIGSTYYASLITGFA